MTHEKALCAVRVPSSTSNLGAGFDCLGLALDIWLEASIVEGEGPAVYQGTLSGFDPEEDFTANTVAPLVPTGYHLEVSSEVPVSRGLGSSAAAIVAGFALAQLLSRGTLNRGEVFKKTTKHEGHPDNAGPATYGGLFLHAGFPKRFAFHKDLGVALAVPDQEINTHEARGLIPAQLSRADAIGQASSAAALLAGLTTGDGDLVRHGMVDRIAVPARRDLIDGYDKAVDAGVDAGAFGVTISGAGSTLVAICPLELARSVADAIAGVLTTQGNPARALHPSVVETGVEVLERHK